jgi:Trypsin-like peptidase domain
MNMASKASAFSFFSFVLISLMCMDVRQTSAATAAEVQARFDKAKNAVVKVTVTGTKPDGITKVTREGSGFFVFSNKDISFLLTAQHVVGSSETDQTRNSDWLVEDGDVKRKIKIESLNEQGSLVVRSDDASVAPLNVSNVDIALIGLQQGPFAHLPLVSQFTEKVPLHDVMLMGFQAGESSLRKPIPIGTGQIVRLRYATSIPSKPGESGGPWIDLGSGKVFAVACCVKNSPGGTLNDSTPVTYVKQALIAYFQVAGLDLDDPATVQYANADPKPDFFSELDRSANVRFVLNGTEFVEMSKSGQLGDLVQLTARGNESSQCDSGYGRTFSQSGALAEVTKLGEGGLRFIYDISAQGGHYRSAATCFGSNLIGVRGNDTSATAQVAMEGKLDFATNGAPLAVNWNSMPDAGATFQLVNQSGKIVSEAPIAGSGNLIFRTLSPGKYTLVTSIRSKLENRGSCCGKEKKINGTLAINPVPFDLTGPASSRP